MRVADTSVLYALVAQDDAHYAAARAAVADPDPILVPAEVLVESLHLAGMRLSHEAAVDLGRAVRSLPHIEVQPSWDDPRDDIQGHAWRLFQEDRKLSPTDAIVAAWCHVRRLQPLTFDAHLRRVATRRPAARGR